MARSFNGTTDMCFFSTMPFGPIGGVSVCAWLYRNDNTQTNRLIFEYDQTNGFDVVANQAGAGVDLIRSYHGAVTWADTYVAPAAGAWHHYVWVIPSDSAGVPPPNPQGFNKVFIDGVQQTLTPGTHGSVGTIASSAVFTWAGRRTGTTNSNFYGCRIAEAVIYGANFADTNVNQRIGSLARGACPLDVLKEGVVMYLPFHGDNPESDWHGLQRDFTIVGTPAVVNHPPTARSTVNFQL